MGKYGLSDFLCGRKNPIELADSAKPEADLQTLLWLILQKIQTIILPNNKSLNADFFFVKMDLPSVQLSSVMISYHRGQPL